MTAMKVIEFLGMPRAGKTTQINRLQARLKKDGWRVAVLTDRIRAENIRTPVSEGMAYTLVFFSQAIEFYYESLDNIDYLLIDRGFVDVSVWADVHVGLGDFTPDQAESLKVCFRPFTRLVEKTLYFQVPIDIALQRHEAGGEHQAVDDVAMNRTWLELLEASYKKNEGSFPNMFAIDGTMSPDETEASIWKFVS